MLVIKYKVKNFSLQYLGFYHHYVHPPISRHQSRVLVLIVLLFFNVLTVKNLYYTQNPNTYLGDMGWKNLLDGFL